MLEGQEFEFMIHGPIIPCLSAFFKKVYNIKEKK